jgi:hypothetical protein
MNTPTTNSSAHLADDQLLRLIDGDDDAQRSTWQAHVAACTRCAGEVEALRLDARLVSRWLERAAFEDAAATDEPAGLLLAGTAAAAGTGSRTPAQPAVYAWHRTAPWLRAAAVIALLATPVAAIPSLRQWLVQSLTDAGTEPAVTTGVPASVRAPQPGIIRFTPAPGAFIVEIAVSQAAGELRVARATGDEAVFQAAAPDGAVPVVSAALLRIANRATDRTSYSLQVPASVSSVTVRVAGRSVVLERGRIDAGAVVRLH